MTPENIVWAFFSPSHYQQKIDDALISGVSAPKDIYYKDFTGKWVRVTGVFDCIEKARNEYRYSDAKYLGGVLMDTKGEVTKGGIYPPLPVDPNNPTPRPLKKKKRLNRPNGTPGTVSIKRSYLYDSYSSWGYPD